MKCQNCGKSEVNFHYSSNINGCVTESHLCSECAANLGYNMEEMFDFRSMMSGFNPLFTGRNYFMPQMLPFTGFGMPSFFTVRPLIEAGSCSADQKCGCSERAASDTGSEVDGDMKERRELYMQMRAAAESEDFEKAAELRDKIKEMESQDS